MKITHSYSENEIKALLIKALSPLQVEKITFKVIDGRDAHDRPGGGHTVQCDVELKVSDGQTS